MVESPAMTAQRVHVQLAFNVVLVQRVVIADAVFGSHGLVVGTQGDESHRGIVAYLFVQRVVLKKFFRGILSKESESRALVGYCKVQVDDRIDQDGEVRPCDLVHKEGRCAGGKMTTG